VEGLALRLLSRAAVAEAAKGATAMLRLNRVVGPLSALGVLIPGLYMTATSWGWVPWIVVALVSWLVIAVLGAVNGIRIVALERSDALLTGIRNPLFVISWITRLGIAMGVIFLMTVKPGGIAAVLVVLIAAAAGAALGLAVSKRRQMPDTKGQAA
jgi:hypothetical protein